MPDDYADKVSTMSYKQVAAYTIERFALPDDTENVMASGAKWRASIVLNDGTEIIKEKSGNDNG